MKRRGAEEAEIAQRGVRMGSVTPLVRMRPREDGQPFVQFPVCQRLVSR